MKQNKNNLCIKKNMPIFDKRIYSPSEMVVKFSPDNQKTAFVRYKLSSGRVLSRVVDYFRNQKGFRFAVIYRYSKQSGRGSQIAYFDNSKLLIYDNTIIR